MVLLVPVHFCFLLQLSKLKVFLLLHITSAVLKRLCMCELITKKQMIKPILFISKDSTPLLRTFSGHFVTGKDPSAEDIDLDVLGGSGGSGMEVEEEAGKWHGHHSQRRHPQEQFFVSEEAKGFLQGRLATTFVPTVYTLVFIISVPLNLVAVGMFVRYIHPRKAAVIYMLNLACADLLFGLFLPFKIAYHYHGNNWIYGSFMCRLVTASVHCNMYFSVLLVTCISIDRFLAVVYPMDSLKWRSPQTAAAVCAAMWLVSLGGVFPLLMSTQTVRLSDLGITTCHDVQGVEKLQGFYLYFFPVYSAVFFFLPLIFTAVCYTRILQTLAEGNVENRSKRTRAMVMAGMVLLVFVVCFTPTNIILMVHYVQLAHSSGDGSYQAYLLSVCMGSISCCLDPLLYYFGSSQCRKQVMTLFGCRRPAQSSLEAQSTRADGSTNSKMESSQTGPGSHYSRLEA